MARAEEEPLSEQKAAELKQKKELQVITQLAQGKRDARKALPGQRARRRINRGGRGRGERGRLTVCDACGVCVGSAGCFIASVRFKCGSTLASV